MSNVAMSNVRFLLAVNGAVGQFGQPPSLLGNFDGLKIRYLPKEISKARKLL